MTLSHWHENPDAPLPDPPEGVNGDTHHIWTMIRTVDTRSNARYDKLEKHVFDIYKMMAGSTLVIVVILAVLDRT